MCVRLYSSRWVASVLCEFYPYLLSTMLTSFENFFFFSFLVLLLFHSAVCQTAVSFGGGSVRCLS